MRRRLPLSLRRRFSRLRVRFWAADMLDTRYGWVDRLCWSLSLVCTAYMCVIWHQWRYFYKGMFVIPTIVRFAKPYLWISILHRSANNYYARNRIDQRSAMALCGPYKRISNHPHQGIAPHAIDAQFLGIGLDESGFRVGTLHHGSNL